MNTSYWHMNATKGGANLLLGANCAYKRGLSVMFLRVLFVLALTRSGCIVSGISILLFLQPLISYNAETILSVALLHN